MVRKTFALAGKGTDCQVGKGLSVNSIDLGKAAERKQGPGASFLRDRWRHDLGNKTGTWGGKSTGVTSLTPKRGSKRK